MYQVIDKAEQVNLRVLTIGTLDERVKSTSFFWSQVESITALPAVLIQLMKEYPFIDNNVSTSVYCAYFFRYGNK